MHVQFIMPTRSRQSADQGDPQGRLRAESASVSARSSTFARVADPFVREPDLEALEALAAQEAGSATEGRGPSRFKGRGTGVVIGHRYDKVQRTAPVAAEGVIWLASDDSEAAHSEAVPIEAADRQLADHPGAGRGAADSAMPAAKAAGGPAAGRRGGGPVGEGDEIVPGPDTEVRFEQARQIIATNDSPDVPFEQSINPYRGCEHGCIYCFARPTHAYLDLSPGLDFERIIIAKGNAAERFRAQLARPGYRCRTVTLGAATDPYQPVERKLGITRAVIEVAAEHRHPVFVVTKSALVERDLDLIGPMSREGLAGVMVTLTTLDPEVARVLEPRANAPHRRLRAIETLARAGVPVALSVGPIIPFINETDIEKIIKAAAAAGARSVHYTVVRLPWEVAPLFEQWLADHFPARADRVMARIREMRGGRRNDPRFGSRIKGEGVYAQLIRARVARAARENGLERRTIDLDESKFIGPARTRVVNEDRNLSLF